MVQPDGSILIKTKLDEADFKKGLNQMQADADKTAKGVVRDFEAMTKSTFDLTSAIKASVAALAAFKGVELGQEAVLAAARYETLGIVMSTAGNNAGRTAKQMAESEAELRKVGIAAIEARESLARMAASGINLDFSAKIARAAQDVAVVGGINSSEAFERMIRGIQSGEVEILKTMGLNVQWEESYKKLAVSIGKSVDALSAQEKLQARTNAVLQQASNYAGIYEQSMETAGKQMGSLARYTSDLSVKVGDIGLDALAFGVKDVTKYLKDANEAMDKLADAGVLDEWRGSIGQGFKEVVNSADVAAVALGLVVSAQKAATIAERVRTSEVVQGIVASKASTEATLQNANAEHVAALAARELAAAKVAAAKSEYAMLEAMGGTTAITVQQAAAFQRLVSAERELTAANTTVAQSTAAMDAAQGKASTSARALAASQSLLAGVGTKIVTGAKAVFTAIGGWPTLIAAAGTAIYALATRQTESEKVAQSYNQTIAGLKVGADSAANAMADLEKRVASMSKEQAAFNFKDAEISLVKLRGELDKFVWSFDSVNFDDVLDGLAEGAEAVKGPFNDLIANLKNGEIGAEDFRKKILEIGTGADESTRNTVKQLTEMSYSFESASKMVELLGARAKNSGTSATEMAEHWKIEMTKASKAVDTVGESIKKVDDAAKVKGIEGAYKILKDLSKGTDESKASAIANAKAQYDEAIAILRKTAEAEKATGVMKQMAGMDAYSAGQAELAAKLFDQAAQHFANSARLAKDAATAEGKRDSIDWKKLFDSSGAKSAGKSAVDALRQIREQIDAVGTSDLSFSVKLAKGLEEITNKAKGTKIAADALQGLREEFIQVSSADYLDKLQRKFAEMGDSAAIAAVKERDMARGSQEVYDSMLTITGSVEQATAAQQRYKYLSAQQVKINGLQEQITLLKELETLSGSAGVSIEKQNELITMQADRFRAAYPELKAYVDEWERLKKQQASQDYGEGLKRAAQTFSSEWTDAAKVGEKQMGVMISGIQQLGTSAVDAIFGDAEFRADQFFKQLLKQMMQIAMNQMIGGIFKMLLPTPTGHTGGIIGVPDSNVSKQISPFAFAGAKRYHAGGILGLSSNEVPFIGLKNEGVFTEAQMKALAPVSAVQPVINLQVVNETGVEATPQVSQSTSNGQTDITVALVRAAVSEVDRRIATGGSTSQAIQRTFNTSPYTRGR